MQTTTLKSLIILFLSAVSLAVQNVMESSSEFWNKRAQNYIESKLIQSNKLKDAKNIIFFIGDGLSIPTISATRMYVGKEETQLSFENFPYYGLSKTYCVDKQTPDSACTATAYFCGVKNNMGTIGVNANVKKSQCIVEEADNVYSIAKWAQNAGKSTGIVTTTRVTHASPAGAYAHTSNRDWEDNSAIEEKCRNIYETNVKDIAHQLIHSEEGKKIKVILGGGRKHFINSSDIDDEGRRGSRTDGRNLINEWLTARDQKGKAQYVSHNQQLKEIDYDNTDYLLGLFENSHCLYNLDILNNNLQHQEPSLTDMTAAAIKILQKDSKGFFLFVEGGRIDHAHHDNKVMKTLEETKEFSRAIDIAKQMTSSENTLIVVSSDHSHVFTYNGYPERGNDIFNMLEVSDIDGLPYETLSYANGPGYATTYVQDSNKRVNISNQDHRNPEKMAAATVPLISETHAGEDVAVFAIGPWSQLFVGSYEQNNLPLLMAYAAKIGPYSNDIDTSGVVNLNSFVTVVLIIVLVKIQICLHVYM